MSSFFIPESGKLYRIYNQKSPTNLYLFSRIECQAKVGDGPGNDGEWFWSIEVINTFPGEKKFNALIHNKETNMFLSTTAAGTKNRVYCYGYSDTTRKHWEFLWDDSVSKFRIINLSRQGVGVGTKYLGSNAQNDFVFVGGDLITPEYTWVVKEDYPPQ